MDEKVLLEWKEAHAEVYAKFKEDLEAVAETIPSEYLRPWRW